jgi:hypothetical protein
MKTLVVTISVASLGVLLAAPMLYVLGVATAATGRYGMVIGTLGWFLTSPFWIRRPSRNV